MTRDDERRARFIGEILANQGDQPNPAAGLPVSASFEANAQAHGDLARRAQRSQGVPITTPLFERIMRLFKF